MSNTVDNRVVEMTFDNKQFENGVKTSLNTLDKLNEKLKFKDSASGLKTLSGRFKDFAFDGMYSGLDALQYRFSTLGIVGATVIQNLTNTALNFGRNLWANTLGQIKSGGLSRAMNIEQAKFQLEGLKVEWEDISKDIDYGVKDTAYGLDAAAKAASQLVASGIKFGDTFGETGNSPMAKALRGISGVAAMTNSSYEDISHIFTTIAGNGRVMGENLQQFAGRGLNVAATLAEALGTTEEKVREMVSKGKIDFATFSEAMNKAFGDHAKDANKTFTGALSNMKAALSRIGASFYQPGLEKARDLFNSIRPIINGVHKAMAPMISDYEGLLNRVVPRITGALDKLAGNDRFYRNLQLTYDILKQTINWFLKYVKPIRTAFNDIVPRKTVYDIRDVLLSIQRFVNGLKTYGSTLHDLTRTFRGVFAIFDIFKTIVSSVLRVLAPLKGKTTEYSRSILNVTGNIGDWLVNLSKTIKANDSIYKAITKVIEYISTKFQSAKAHVLSLIEVFKEFWTVGRMRNISDAWEGIKAIGDIFTLLYVRIRFLFGQIKPLCIELLKGFGGVLLGLKPYLIDFIDTIIAIIGQFGIWAQKIRDFIKTNSSITNAFYKILSAILRARNAVHNFFAELSGKHSNKETKDSTSAMDRVSEAALTIESVLGKFAGHVKSIFEKIGNILGRVWDRLKAMLAPIVEGFKNAFSNLTFDNLLDAINTGIFGVFLMRFGFFERSLSWKASRIRKTFSFLGGNFKTLYENLSHFSKLFVDIKGAFEKLNTTFSDMAKSQVIKDMAVSVLILAGAMLLLSTIDTKKLITSLAVVYALTVMLEDFYNFIDEVNRRSKGGAFNKETQGFTSIASGFVIFGVALFIIASAIKKLGNMEPEKLMYGMLSILTLLASMVGAIKYLSTIQADKYLGYDTGYGITSIAKAFIPLAVSLYIIAGAVKKLAKLDTTQLIQGVASILVIMAALTTVVKVLSSIHFIETKSKGIKKILGAMIYLAIALRIIASSIKVLGKMERGQLEKGVISVIVILGALAVIIATLSTISDIDKFGNSFKKVSNGIVAMSIGLLIIAFAIKQLGNLEQGKLEKGVISVIVILGALTLLMMVLSTIDDFDKFSKGFGRIAISIAVLSIALMVIAKVIENLGSISGEGLVNAIGSLISVLATIVAFAYAMSQISDVGKTTMALVGMSLALVVLAKAMTAMGEMSLPEIGKSLLMLVGTLGALGLAAYALERFKLVDTFNKLSNSLLKFGISVALTGAGLLALSIALGILAGTSVPAAMSFIASMTIIIGWLQRMLPTILAIIGDAIVILIRYLGQHAVAIIEALVEIGRGILKGLRDLVPDIVDTGMYLIISLLEGIMNNIYRITECVALIIIYFISALAKYQDLITDAGLTLIINFINGMANAIREHGEQMLAAVENLVSSILEFIISAIQELVRAIPVFGEGIAQDLEGVKENLKNTFSVSEMAEVGSNVIEGTAQGMENHKDRLESASRNVLQDTKSIFATESGFGGTFGNMIGTDFANGLSDMSWLASDNGSLLSESALSGVMSNSDLFSATGTDLGNSLFSGLEGVDAGNISESQVSDYLMGWEGNQEEASNAGLTLLDSVTTGLTDFEGEFNKTGEKQGTEYYSGVNDKQDEAESAGEALKSAAQDGAGSGYWGMYNNGSNAGRGYYDGLMSWNKPISDAAAAMTNAGIDTTAKTQKSQSPSKVYQKLGSYAGEGYVGGIVPFIGKVANVAKEMVDSGISIAKLGVSSISDILNADLDDAPIISPVLDLTNIQNGANSIDEMLSKTKSIGINATRNANAIYSAGRSSSLNAEGSLNGGTPTYNFTQNNYSPKALSRIDIYRQTRNQFAQMKGLAGV